MIPLARAILSAFELRFIIKRYIRICAFTFTFTFIARILSNGGEGVLQL